MLRLTVLRSHTVPTFFSPSFLSSSPTSLFRSARVTSVTLPLLFFHSHRRSASPGFHPGRRRPTPTGGAPLAASRPPPLRFPAVRVVLPPLSFFFVFLPVSATPRQPRPQPHHRSFPQDFSRRLVCCRTRLAGGSRRLLHDTTLEIRSASTAFSSPRRVQRFCCPSAEPPTFEPACSVLPLPGPSLRGASTARTARHLSFPHPSPLVRRLCFQIGERRRHVACSGREGVLGEGMGGKGGARGGARHGLTKEKAAEGIGRGDRIEKRWSPRRAGRCGRVCGVW